MIHETFYQGTWDRAYEYFGVHRSGDGWVFRVWAPNARRVQLSGDFNSWQGWDMERRGGAWELTVDHADVYDAYKYIVNEWRDEPQPPMDNEQRRVSSGKHRGDGLVHVT